jgi:hypothetical protein
VRPARNPVYLKAFVFGRTHTEKRIDPAGEPSRGPCCCCASRAVLILTITPDRRLGHGEANTAAPGELVPRAVRRRSWEGSALLQGRIRCGNAGG